MAKVLVVEDDNNLREIYETSLKAEGYETTSAADGMEALELASRDKPDLIISDVMMPRLSGFEMLEKLRQDDNLKDIPVIMMTALSMAEDKETAKRLGVVHYLVKSQVTLEDFVNVAKKFVPADGSSPAAVVPAVEPSTAPAVASQPTSAPEPTPEPKLAPEPVPAAPDEPSATTVATEPPSDPPATAPVAQNNSAVSSSQTTTQETDAVEAKINDFIASQPMASTAPQAEAPTDSPPATDSQSETDKQGKKIIQPPSGEQKDIHELAKAEEAKESPESPPNQKPTSGADPSSIAL